MKNHNIRFIPKINHTFKINKNEKKNKINRGNKSKDSDKSRSKTRCKKDRLKLKLGLGLETEIETETEIKESNEDGNDECNCCMNSKADSFYKRCKCSLQLCRDCFIKITETQFPNPKCTLCSSRIIWSYDTNSNNTEIKQPPRLGTDFLICLITEIFLATIHYAFVFGVSILSIRAFDEIPFNDLILFNIFISFLYMYICITKWKINRLSLLEYIAPIILLAHLFLVIALLYKKIGYYMIITVGLVMYFMISIYIDIERYHMRLQI